MGGACLGPYQAILQSLLDTACLQTRWWVEEQATWVRQSACSSRLCFFPPGLGLSFPTRERVNDCNYNRFL